MHLRTIVASLPALNKLMQQPLPLPLAYQLGLLLRQLTPYLTAYEAIRKNLLARYGAMQDGEQVIPERNQAAFVKELDPILDEDISLADMKLLIEDFPEHVVLTPAEAAALLWLLTDEEPSEHGTPAS